jgi:RNA polymerase sigma factor for flagellar operon FliA
MNSIGDYKKTDSIELEDFVIAYIPLVKTIALSLKRRLPSFIEVDDLCQNGLMGLLEARQHYKENEGANFKTFASIRIRGAMIDSLRKNSWLPRDAAKKIRNVAVAIHKIEQREQRPAESEEIAKELGIDIEAHGKLVHEISNYYVVNIDNIDFDLANPNADNPLEKSIDHDFICRLQKALPSLPEREQMVLSLYYVEEFTLKQIGEVLGLSEARVCQLHTQAIARLKIKFNSALK